MIRSLPLPEWPSADRFTWIEACEPGQRLRRGGRASHIKKITRDDLERRYGYYLQFLYEKGDLPPSAPAGTQVTPDLVELYIQRVGADWSSVTLAQSIYKLRRMAELLAPETDFGWLRDREKDLALLACPKERFDQIVTSETLIEAGLTLVREAQLANRRRPLWRALSMRDGLMVAMLAHHPIRLKNFAALELGKSVVRIRDDWWIVLGRRDTKAGRPDERICDETLRQAVALYLTWARPRLLRMRDNPVLGGNGHIQDRDGRSGGAYVGPLWIGQYGEPLDYGCVERRVLETTRATIGVPVSPHDFRRNAATTAAFLAGSDPHVGNGLLQHVGDRTREEHYNRASNLTAAVEFGRMVSGLRSNCDLHRLLNRGAAPFRRRSLLSPCC